MAHEDRAFYDQLADRGVTRRDFLKFCGSVAAMLGLSEAMVPTVASAVEQAAASTLTPAVWIDGGLCTGCTESTAQGTTPDVAQIVLDILSMNYMETIMYATGADAEAALKDTVEKYKGKFIMVYEGSVMTGFDGNALRVAGKTGLKQIKEVAPNAAAIIAVGSCAVDGGWVKSNPNLAGAMGIQEYLKQENIATPVINLPTCPVNPEWIVAMVIDVLFLGKLESGQILKELDESHVDQFDAHEIGLVNADHLGAPVHLLQNFGRTGDHFRLHPHVAVRNNLRCRIPRIDGGLKNLHPLAGDQCAP